MLHPILAGVSGIPVKAHAFQQRVHRIFQLYTSRNQKSNGL
jgi:hypothetical protein